MSNCRVETAGTASDLDQRGPGLFDGQPQVLLNASVDEYVPAFDSGDESRPRPMSKFKTFLGETSTLIVPPCVSEFGVLPVFDTPVGDLRPTVIRLGLDDDCQ